jgi:hypothetical protein
MRDCADYDFGVAHLTHVEIAVRHAAVADDGFYQTTKFSLFD